MSDEIRLNQYKVGIRDLSKPFRLEGDFFYSTLAKSIDDAYNNIEKDLDRIKYKIGFVRAV